MKNKNGGVKHFTAGAALALLIVAAAPTGANYFASLLAQEGGMPPMGGQTMGQPPSFSNAGGQPPSFSNAGGQPPSFSNAGGQPPMGGSQMGGQQGQFGSQMSGQSGSQGGQFGNQQPGFGTQTAGKTSNFMDQKGPGTQTAGGKMGPTTGFDQKGSTGMGSFGTQGQFGTEEKSTFKPSFTSAPSEMKGSNKQGSPSGIIDPAFKPSTGSTSEYSPFEKFSQKSTGTKFQTPVAPAQSLKKDWVETEVEAEERDYEKAFKSVLKGVDLKKAMIGKAKSPASLRSEIAKRAQALEGHVCAEETGYDCETEVSYARDALMEVLSENKPKAKNLIRVFVEYVTAMQDMVDGGVEEDVSGEEF